MKEIDLDIYDKQDLKKANRYNPVYKRLSSTSLKELAKICKTLDIDFKILTNKLNKFYLEEKRKYD